MAIPISMLQGTLDLWATSRFSTADAENMYLCYEFKENLIILEAYSLRSYFDAPGYGPKHWVIDVSMDGKEWVTVDTQSDNSDLKEQNRTASFRIQNPVRCKFVRWKQTGKNHHGHYNTPISSFEVFGRIVSSRSLAAGQ